MPPTKEKNKLRKTNRKIIITGKQAIKALQEIGFMFISLRQMEDYYFYKEIEAPGQDPGTRAREISRFVTQNSFINRLAVVRKTISERFDNSLGNDDMSDSERAMEHLTFWEKLGD
ncbi:hypothetical protein [Pseudomonas sp. NPDC088444]|uniref:hypothetical protein n=1 Tax=Pseudomonas sp. NPDC088444 TaxID=3364456 RepID=UPI00385090FA